ncbi:MAG TPA: helix-turn-helix transcriptional regulator [Gemmatimonadaceae bacterium]|nr:helix-turn-helix transcriptional regulator [Gemmatimonadaceae bacterium]
MSQSVLPRAADLLGLARIRSGLSQRELARRAKTAQSVVARIEKGQTIPSLDTLDRLVAAAGFELRHELSPKPVFHSHMLDDCARILRLSPAERLREVRNVSRFIIAARRA